MNREREEAGEPLFANPRNAAAGTMRNLDPSLVSKRGLGAFFYQLVDADDGRWRRSRPHAETLAAHARAGDCRSNRTGGAAPASTRSSAFCDEWAEKRRTLAFDTDGVVIKVDDLALRAAAGRDREVSALGDGVQVSGASRRRPCCRRIAVNVGRTGAVTPYAVLEPVFLAGSTISMATLHNAEDIARKDLRDGDRVLIEKAGDVIPKVVKPILPHPDDSVPFVMPTDVSGVPQRRCSATRKKSSGAARTRRARRGSGAASNTSRRARR